LPQSQRGREWSAAELDLGLRADRTNVKVSQPDVLRRRAGTRNVEGLLGPGQAPTPVSRLQRIGGARWREEGTIRVARVLVDDMQEFGERQATAADSKRLRLDAA
jgi:hypothetical protein